MSVITEVGQVNCNSPYEVFKFEKEGDKLFMLVSGFEEVEGDLGVFTSIKGVAFEPKASVQETLSTGKLVCIAANKMIKTAIDYGSIRASKAYSFKLTKKDVKSKSSKFKYNEFAINKLQIPDDLLSEFFKLIPENQMEVTEVPVAIQPEEVKAPKRI